MNVSSEYIVNLPTKTVYSLGDSLNTNGCSIEIYDSEGLLLSQVNITSDMIIDYDTNQTGSQIVTFTYDEKIYGFEIYILSETQEISTFNDFIILNSEIIQGERIDFALTKSNLTEFINLVNVYDYEQINIYGLIISTDQEVKKIKYRRKSI